MNPEIDACERSHGASLRPPLHHPSRKVTYRVLSLDREIGAAESVIEGLIRDLREAGTDPATWDEVIELRRALRSVSHQIVHVIEANRTWAEQAAHADCDHSQKTADGEVTDGP